MRIWRPPLWPLVVLGLAACHDSDRKTESPRPSPSQLAAPSSPAQSPPGAELASIAWTPSNSDQNLQAFDLVLTGGDVLAVCHVPAGWTLNVTGAGGGATVLKGYATVGAAFVGFDNLADVAGVFLIRPRPGEALGVSGKLTIGVYGGDAEQTQLPASAASLRLEPAAQCPPPKAH